ncbi:hypothetical protein L6164_000889 [Bauhinia variegata]|uniref:Uncharacterized protein n=1 Tax=Bauhinia variegata TaxID=167791 RepID=A0ACB9Q7C8_BAUVA|nr:hypothetical protein L6164_000889 [Bauhinia variegata]
MDLSHSQLLTQVTDVSGAPNITTLQLEGCINLKVIHDSVGRLTKLLDLSLEGCTNLEVFPHGIYMTSLRSLNFNDCVSLQHFPEILGQMDNLNRIDAERTGIKQIPHSICYLPKLESLFLRFNDNLESIPESINQLDALRNLNLHDCKKLQHISGFPRRLQDICVVGCIPLTSQSLNTVWSQVLQEIEFLNVSMPRTRIPNWFDYRCTSGRLSFWASRKYPKFAFAVVCGKSTNKISSELVHIIVLIYLHGPQDFVTAHYSGGYFNNEGGTFLLELREYLTNFNHDDLNLVEIICTTSSPDYEIEECGVYMYKQDINIEDIQFVCSIPNNSNMNAVMSRDAEKIEEAKHRTERAVFSDLREFTRGCPMPLNSIMEAVMAMDDESNEDAEPGKSSNTGYVKE